MLVPLWHHIMFLGDRFFNEFSIAYLIDFGPNGDYYFASFGVRFPY